MNLKRVIFFAMMMVLAPVAVYATGGVSVNTTVNLDLGPSTAPVATLDLTNNSAIIGGVTTYTNVQQYINYAYDSGLWDLNGITSSVAQGHKSDIKYALGIMSVPDFQTLYGTHAGFYGPTLFPGSLGVDDVSTLAAGTTLTRFTYLGDGNFDGVTNSSDTVNLLTSIVYQNLHGVGTVAGTWKNGDFDLNGSVNSSDTVLELGAIVYQNLHGNWSQLTAGGNITPVPEPSIFILGLMAAACLFCFNKFRK